MENFDKENFDRENIDELLEIRQICQYFPPSKFFTVRYIMACRSLWQWIRTGMEWNQWNGVIVSYKSNNNMH